MPTSRIPRILRPDFTWRRPVNRTISKQTPPVPSVPGRIRRRLWGFIHKFLIQFSIWYCSWLSIEHDPNISQLPFGLVLKWTDRASLEEALAMKMAEAAGMPVPKVLCCGDHPEDELDVETEGPWLEELKDCVQSMRLWQPPRDQFVCSVIGTAVRSTRVPSHVMGPFATPEQFYEYLLAPASDHAFKSEEEYDTTLERAKKLHKPSHQVKFTHGDFKAHNILVDDDGHLSGFLDWESGGWCPEYWDFTTAMRFGVDTWWFRVAAWMGGDQYLEELACDKAVNKLTVDSYIFF